MNVSAESTEKNLTFQDLLGFDTGNISNIDIVSGGTLLRVKLTNDKAINEFVAAFSNSTLCYYEDLARGGFSYSLTFYSKNTSDKPKTYVIEYGFSAGSNFNYYILKDETSVLKLAKKYYDSIVEIDSSETNDNTQTTDNIKTNNVSLYVNGFHINLKNKPAFINNNGRVMIPVRIISELFGNTVNWNGQNQEVTINNSYKIAKFTIGGDNCDINYFLINKDDSISMDSKAIILNNVAYVPIRYWAQALGLNIEWNGDKNTININY
jgi:hypothetical protein